MMMPGPASAAAATSAVTAAASQQTCRRLVDGIHERQADDHREYAKPHAESLVHLRFLLHQSNRAKPLKAVRRNAFGGTRAAEKQKRPGCQRHAGLS
jgi:hypothetical protein